MTCPFCKTEMLDGFLNCGNLIWSERRHKISTNADSTERYALNLPAPLLSPHQIKSTCCPKCKHIIIDASEYEHRLEKR